MRLALWLLGLFAIAVAAALFAGNNQGTVTLYWPPWRLDLSLNLAVLALALLFLALHVTLRALSALLRLPQEARRWRAQQKERAAHVALLEAAAYLQAGRFVRARKAAQTALGRLDALTGGGDALGHAPLLRAMAHLLSAEGAQALQDRATRDQHLRLAIAETREASLSEMAEGVHLRAARWALDDRDPAMALQWLQELPQGAARRTLALRLKLKAARLAGRIPDALETARLLVKHKAFAPAAARVLLRGLLVERLGQAHDLDQLRRVWNALEPSERAMPEVAVQAARRLVELGGAAEEAGPWLLPAWLSFVESPTQFDSTLRSRFLSTIEDQLVTDDETLAREWLARVETAVQRHPRQAELQYLAGVACLRHQLWGKAQQWLSQSAPQLQDAVLARRAWTALAGLAEQRGDATGAAGAWKSAARSGA